MFCDFDVEAWHQNGANLSIEERIPLAEAIKNNTDKDVFQDFATEELYKMINVATDSIIISRTSEYEDAWNAMISAVQTTAQNNPEIIFELKVTTTDTDDTMNGTEYIRYHGNETEYHKAIKQRGPFTKIFKEAEPYARNNDTIDIHINNKPFIVLSNYQVNEDQTIMISESIRNMLREQPANTDYEIANIIKTILRQYKINGEVLLPSHQIAITAFNTIAVEHQPITPADIRSQYVAAKIWTREDIASMLQQNHFEGTDAEIDEVINTGILENLEDCTDEDWQTIEDAIRQAQLDGNITPTKEIFDDEDDFED